MGLQRQREANVSRTSMDGMTVKEQLDAIQQQCCRCWMNTRDCWQEDLEPALAARGRLHPRLCKAGRTGQALSADQYFLKHVFPILTPLAVDPGHPFPFISQSEQIAGRDAGTSRRRTRPLGCASRCRKICRAGCRCRPGMHFVPLEQVIAGEFVAAVSRHEGAWNARCSA